VSYVYVDPGKTIVDFVHTFVPPQWRGAKSTMAVDIPKMAFAWASSKNLKIKRSCWYLQDVIGPSLIKEYGHLYV
jgi:predicted GNAT family acetyltransferase